MKTSKRMLISKYFLRKVTWIMLKNMENLEELLKRFQESKAFSSDEIKPNIYFIFKNYYSASIKSISNKDIPD